MWRRTMLVVAVVCLWPLMVVADDDSPACPLGMMGGGMGMGSSMMGGGMMGWGGMMGAGPIMMLDLSDDQRAKVNKILDDVHHKNWATMGQIMDLKAKSRDLYDADKRDVQAILKNEEQVDQLHRKMLEVHLTAQGQMEAVLTKEQLVQLRNLRRQHHGPGGPGGGMMGPGGGYGPRGMMGR